VLRTIEIKTGPIPSEAPVNLSAEAVEPTITISHTAKIRFSIENTTDVLYWRNDASNRTFPFGSVTKPDEDKTFGDGLWLATPDMRSRGFTKASTTCWRPARSGNELQAAGVLPVHHDVPKSFKLKPGKKYSVIREIWERADDSNQCVEPGNYSNDFSYSLGKTPENNDIQFDWSIELVVEK
jgi:hypothetical protein